MEKTKEKKPGNFKWKLIKCYRLFKVNVKWVLQIRSIFGLMKKTIHSIRVYGFKTTWQRIKYRKNDMTIAMEYSKTPLFSDAELEEQRNHVFPQDLKISIIVPLYNTPKVFLREMIDSVLEQTYGNFELCMADGSDDEHPEVEQICMEYVNADSRIRYQKLEENMGISGNTNACIDMVTGDYVALFDHDDVLHPAALYEVMRAICELGADYIYTDESVFKKTPEEAYLSHFKPDFAPDNLCANNYICHLSVFKKSLLDKVGKFDPECNGSQDHDMILRLTEQAEKIVHIPEVLYYWRAHGGSVAESTSAKPYVFQAGINAVKRHLKRVGLEGEVTQVRAETSIYRVRYKIQGTPKVSILIQNTDHLFEFKKCIESIFENTTYDNYEIVIVDHQSKLDTVFDYYKELQENHDNVKVLEKSGKKTHSALANYTAEQCTGDYLLFLDYNTAVVTPDWIQELLMYAQRSDVGAAGCLLYDSKNNIYQAGIGIGLLGLVGHFFRGVNRNHIGYMGRLLYAQNVSAVSAACMMVRRDVWEEMNGFEEKYIAAYYDVDLCLRMREKDYLIVWTPFAEVMYLHPKHSKIRVPLKLQKQLVSDGTLFQQNWLEEIAQGDPYFNPNFDQNREDFYFIAQPKKWDMR